MKKKYKIKSSFKKKMRRFFSPFRVRLSPDEKESLYLFELQSLLEYIIVYGSGILSQEVVREDGRYVAPGIIRNYLASFLYPFVMAAFINAALDLAGKKQRPVLAAAIGGGTGVFYELMQARSGTLDLVDTGLCFAATALYLCRNRRYRVRLIKARKVFTGRPTTSPGIHAPDKPPTP